MTLVLLIVTFIKIDNFIEFLEIVSLYSKKKVTAAAVAATVTENGPPKNEKTNSFGNTKFGIQIAFSTQMCQKPFFKDKRPMEAPLGDPIILNLRKLFTYCFQNLIQHFIRIQEYFNDIVLKHERPSGPHVGTKVLKI